MIRAALRYAAAGVPVFPVSQGKQPLIGAWQKRAELDPRAIREWWRRWPTANVGLLCSWFWALDVDPRHGGVETLAGLLREHGPLPVTWEQRSGSGGTHYLFRHHRELEGIPLGKWLDGLDLKGNCKHYILGAPSRSRSGPYRWIRGPRDCPIADAPGWLLKAIVDAKRLPAPAPVRMPDNPGDRFERARRYAEQVPGAISGSGGHNATFVLAMKLTRGFGLNEDEALAILRQWNRTCQPPWKDQELRRKVREAARCGSMPFGALLEREVA